MAKRSVETLGKAWLDRSNYDSGDYSNEASSRNARPHISGVQWLCVGRGSETSLDYLAEDLEIDPVALGILAGKADPNGFEDLTEDDFLLGAALETVTDSQRHEIFECLRKAYGDEFKLYRRLWHTQSSLAEEDSEGDEFELTGANSSALEYVTNGFRRF